jgi:hypothetical protein
MEAEIKGMLSFYLALFLPHTHSLSHTPSLFLSLSHPHSLPQAQNGSKAEPEKKKADFVGNDQMEAEIKGMRGLSLEQKQAQQQV